MITFGEIFFCEKVILNPDGSPLSYVNRFTNVKSDFYPYFFGCNVVINFTHSEALHSLLSLRIKNFDAVTIFESNPDLLRSNRPPRAKGKVGMHISLDRIEIPEPGNYTVEILLNDIVKHTEHLSFA